MQTSHRPGTTQKKRLNVLFTLTSMPVGGAETLLANLVRRMDRERFAPEICCLKGPGPLGESLAQDIPVHSHLLHSKWDVRVFRRLCRLIQRRRVDALITVGAGDKMFWGRLAAWWCRVPVICSAIHSTGWPDTIGFLNRRLTRITDAFIAVAVPHAEFLVHQEQFPARKVRVIRNGIDTDRFQPSRETRQAVRAELRIPAAAPVVGIVAALRPEKNHRLFLESAARIKARHPEAHFLIVGDGPERGQLEQSAARLSLTNCTRFLGTRQDIPQLLTALDVFALSSDNEANPVSILEALACGVPVVATDVGSVSSMVVPGETGFLVPPGNSEEFATRVDELLLDRGLGHRLGDSGRLLVESQGSLRSMVQGYEQLITEIYTRNRGGATEQRDNRDLGWPQKALGTDEPALARP